MESVPRWTGGKVDHLPFEIMEIGAVKLDEGFSGSGRVPPANPAQVYPELHYKILEVTHMDPERLKQSGLTFSSGGERIF